MNKLPRKSPSYNSTDTRIQVENGRIRIIPGMQKRVKLIVSTTAAMVKHWKRDVFLFEITHDIQKKLPGNTYSYSDITNAIRRAVSLGMITNPRHGMFNLPKVG